MRIATWNVNSVRARLPLVLERLRTTAWDVLLLQEIKCREVDFPRFELETLGYSCVVLGQKSYNGVAILAKNTLKDVVFGLPGDEADAQARYVEATIECVRVASVYAPNGNPLGSERYDYKLAWMRRLKEHVGHLLDKETPFALGGDFNVIPTENDVHNPKGWEADALFHPPTRALWREILNLGVTDAFRALYPTEKAYTFWDYQSGAWQKDQGLRIDHFLVSPEIADRLKDCTIDRAPRGMPQPSDHTPVIVEILKE